MLLSIKHSKFGIPKSFLHLIEQTLEFSMHMSKHKQPPLQLMLILMSALSKVSFEVLKTSEAFGTKIEVGKFELLIPRNTPSEIP